jgi:uncharacterized membrane protein YeiH
MDLIYTLDLFGVFVFAISGALSAGKKSLDFFGVMVIAVVTALGGGTFRDVILGNTPVLWIKDPLYIVVAIIAAFITLAFSKSKYVTGKWLLYADAFGLALFTILGTQLALSQDVTPVISIMLGMMTGAFGGLIRDIINNEIPLVLRKEIYATAALIGAVTYILLIQSSINEQLSMIISMIITLCIRIVAIQKKLSLPLFEVDKS